eukprot:887841-Pelagomonas_calceolata.AAC.1
MAHTGVQSPMLSFLWALAAALGRQLVGVLTPLVEAGRVQGGRAFRPRYTTQAILEGTGSPLERLLNFCNL